MTSIHFGFLAKENVGSSANLKGRTASNQKELQENFVTPRRALGDVNKNVRTGQTPLSKPVFLGEQNPEKESCKKKKNRRALASISENELKQDFKPKKGLEKPVKSSLTATSKNLASHDDIEKAYRPLQENDNYEDIWPKKERASSYLDKLLSWKPSCFQIWQSEGSDSDHGISDDEELPILSETGDIFEKALYSSTEIQSVQPEAEDLTLPDIDELLLLSDSDEQS
ncbi:uncharacterized protein LOC106873580 [Octopus bimaculoides]|uniref:Uncharacterized protein n=1 Tax=Octopus bimaculoides TaxID=37653 RepID=A0A0L8H0T8_OCTBM|nr:uncharacterized protein LOC106873580 [Octopus bimaculoides]|eukprot:XP_014776499.1 PREDICTED: uncharacterized protein LOC106873580 [Octopus bimaculoides]